jgi:hypothetical protein
MFFNIREISAKSSTQPLTTIACFGLYADSRRRCDIPATVTNLVLSLLAQRGSGAGRGIGRSGRGLQARA